MAQHVRAQHCIYGFNRFDCTEAEIPFCDNRNWVFRDILLEASLHRIDPSLVLLTLSISAFPLFAAAAAAASLRKTLLLVSGAFRQRMLNASVPTYN